MVAAVETMAYAGATPWHGLGNRVDDCIGVDEMLVAAGLDWEVERKPLYMDQDGQQIQTDRYAMIRSTDRKILTYAGPKWFPLQNRDALEFFREYSEAGKLKLETAGALHGGRLVWALANMQHEFEVTRGDKVQGYLLLTSPHQVGRGITVMSTGIRVVCNNTLQAALDSEDSETHYSQSHLNGFDFEAAKTAVEAAHQQLVDQEVQAKLLQKLRMNDDDTALLLAKHFQPTLVSEKNGLARETQLDPENWNAQLRGVMESYYNAPGAEPGTGWGTMNAVTHFADHKAGNKADTRLTSSWFGHMKVVKNRVRTELLELAA